MAVLLGAGDELQSMIEAGDDIVHRLRARADDIETDVRALRRRRDSEQLAIAANTTPTGSHLVST